MAVDSRVAIRTSPPSREAVDDGVPRPMPIRLAPCRDPSARPRPWLASRAARDARHSRSVCCPETFDAQPGDPARPAWMNSPASPDAGLRRGALPCACPQPRRERLRHPCRRAAVTTGADTIVRVSAPQRRSPPMGLDHLVKPPVPRLMSIDVGSHRRAHAALGGAGVRVAHPAIGLQHACLQPRPEPAQTGTVIAAHTPPRQPPALVHGVEHAVHVGLHHRSRPPVLPGTGPVTDRLPGPACRPVPLARCPTRRRIDRLPEPGTPCLQACILAHREASRPLVAMFRRHVPPTQPLRPVPLLLQPLDPCRDIRLPVRSIRLPPHAIHPTGRVLVQVAPAVQKALDVQAPVQVPHAVRRVGCRLVGSPPQGGGLACCPILRCPAPVSWAGGVLPSRPSPGPWLSHARRPRLDTTPPRQTAAFPVHRAPHLPASKCHTVVSVPAASWVRVSPAVPEALLTRLPPFPPTGTDGASHVRRRLAACLPRPEASGGPSPPRPRGGSCGAFGAREHPRRPPPAHVEAVPARQGAWSPLRPAGCSVDASPVVFATCCCLRPRRKTRDEWGAHPYPTGSFPRHDTPSFLGASTPKLSSGGAPESLKSQKPIMPRRLLQRLVRRDVLSTGDCARPTP